MDAMLQTLRTATPAPGQERVLYPGLSEHEEMEARRANGHPAPQRSHPVVRGRTRPRWALAPLATL